MAMENHTTIKFEMEVAAQKLISQYVLNNEHIEKELNEGIAAAFNTFDFKTAVEVQIKALVDKSIKDAFNWGILRDKVKAKADEIVEQYIAKSIEKFKQELEEGKI